jgi:hypothetical protein
MKNTPRTLGVRKTYHLNLGMDQGATQDITSA